MVANDILQYKRKLKRPYLREWYHGKGDDTYRQALATKGRLLMAAKSKRELYIAYRGKEYRLQEFLKKHPKFKPIKTKRRLR